MAKDNKMWIDMCAGSELKDTQGETLSVEGADIEDLMSGKGRLNDNHGKGFFNSLGMVTEAKKIFKSEDCDNDRHKYYWEKIKAPFIYAKGYLFNNEDHPNAKAAAAILRNIHREDAPLVMKASVEGGVLARGLSDSTRLARTKIHSIALTFTPANNATLVEPINLDKSNTDWEADRQLIKSVMHLAETNVPSFRHIQRHASANSIRDNIEKIKSLSKEIGIDVPIDLPDPDVIMHNAVFAKIENNVIKINQLVKGMKIDHLSLINRKIKPSSTVDKKTSREDTMPAHDVVSRWHGKGKIDESHPDHQEMVNHINNLMRIAGQDRSNINHREALRLYETHIKKDNIEKSDMARAAKGVVLSIAMAQIADFADKTRYPDEVEEHACAVHRKIERQKKDTVQEHNSRVSHDSMKLTNKEYGFDEKEPNVPSIKVKNKNKKLKFNMKKALLAGYGGAGAPTDMTGGGVIQPQSLDSKRKKKVKNKLIKAFLKEQEILDKSAPKIRFPNIKDITTRPDQQVKVITKDKKRGADKGIDLDEEEAQIKGLTVSSIKGRNKFKDIDLSSPENKRIITEDTRKRKSIKGAVGRTIVGPYSKSDTKAYMFSNKASSDPEEQGRFNESVGEHEATHYLLNLIDGKYGSNVRHNLVHNMVSMLHDDDRRAISDYLTHKGVYDHANPLLNEEILNWSRNFLTSGVVRNLFNKKRDEFHSNIGGLSHDLKNKVIEKFDNIDHKRLKQSWKKIASYAKSITPEMIRQMQQESPPPITPDILKQGYKDKIPYSQIFPNKIDNEFSKSMRYITCDNCGHEQVFMPHQVKCRDCKHNFSLYRLNSLKS